MMIMKEINKAVKVERNISNWQHPPPSPSRQSGYGSRRPQMRSREWPRPQGPPSVVRYRGPFGVLWEVSLGKGTERKRRKEEEEKNEEKERGIVSNISIAWLLIERLWFRTASSERRREELRTQSLSRFYCRDSLVLKLRTRAKRQLDGGKQRKVS